jgi:hypothetical protein
VNGYVAGTAQRSLVSARTYALLTDGSTVEMRRARPSTSRHDLAITRNRKLWDKIAEVLDAGEVTVLRTDEDIAA